MKLLQYCLISCFFTPLFSYGYAQSKLHPAETQPIMVEQLAGYQQYPAVVKQLILAAQKLSEQNLTYLYGSASPKNAGMDCSGTIYYLLHTLDVTETPRTANQIYQWVKQEGHFHAMEGKNSSLMDFSALKPGDLLFWSGTYRSKDNPAITHVMLYLGKNQQGEPLMFGSSDGRTYQGHALWGVSVFDFLIPRPNSPAKFVGYGCIPKLTCGI